MMKIKTTLEITNEHEINCYAGSEDDNKKWVAVECLKNECDEMSKRFPEEAMIVREFLKNNNLYQPK